MTNRVPPDVVCDAGPLIHLDELNCLDLLADFRSVLVPEQVWQEIEHHRASALKNPSVILQKVPVVISSEAPFQALARADEMLNILRHLPEQSTLYIRPTLLEEIIHNLERYAK